MRYSGLEHRPGAAALTAIACPLLHLTLATTVLLLAAGDDWSRTGHPAVLAVAAANLFEAGVNLLPWRGRRRTSDGWQAIAHARG